jgi:hypothetical protein
MLDINNNEFNELLDNIENIFFLQIGANDGISVDPIHNLIKKTIGGVFYLNPEKTLLMS